jgi:hypothetical protein
MTAAEFFINAWKSFVELTPDAPKIQKLLGDRGERLVNDHVAFRTFNIPGICRDELGTIFENWGYTRSPEELNFPTKKLRACYYHHQLQSLPKVFISELLIEEVSKELRDWILKVTAPAASKKFTVESFLSPTWAPPSLTDYQKFYSQSEYAAWTLAFGIRVNHFTILVNSLSSFQSLEELNEFLLTNHFELNKAGGLIKGTPEALLEQSSTLAKHISWNFAEGKTESIMGCYYEFARRYRLPGKTDLFPGFLPENADKIFESTFER